MKQRYQCTRRLQNFLPFKWFPFPLFPNDSPSRLFIKIFCVLLRSRFRVQGRRQCNVNVLVHGLNDCQWLIFFSCWFEEKFSSLMITVNFFVREKTSEKRNRGGYKEKWEKWRRRWFSGTLIPLIPSLPLYPSSSLPFSLLFTWTGLKSSCPCTTVGLTDSPFKGGTGFWEMCEWFLPLYLSCCPDPLVSFSRSFSFVQFSHWFISTVLNLFLSSSLSLFLHVIFLFSLFPVLFSSFLFLSLPFCWRLCNP